MGESKWNYIGSGKRKCNARAIIKQFVDPKDIAV
jgi:hypothetical protein